MGKHNNKNTVPQGGDPANAVNPPTGPSTSAGQTDSGVAKNLCETRPVAQPEVEDLASGSAKNAPSSTKKSVRLKDPILRLQRTDSLASVASNASSYASAFSTETQADEDFYKLGRDELRKEREEEEEIFRKIEEEALHIIDYTENVQKNAGNPIKDGIRRIYGLLQQAKEKRKHIGWSWDIYEENIDVHKKNMKTREKIRRRASAKLVREVLKGQSQPREAAPKKRDRPSDSSPESEKTKRPKVGGANPPSAADGGHSIQSQPGPQQKKEERKAEGKSKSKRTGKKKEEEKKREDEKKKVKKKMKNLNSTGTTAAAVLVQPAAGETFASVLGRIRADVDPGASKTRVISVSKTGSDGVVLKLSASSDQATFVKVLQEKLEDKGEVTPVQMRPRVLEVLDLDPITTEEEVTEALRRDLKQEDVGAIKLLEANRRGQRLAVVTLPQTLALQLLRNKFVKVGLVDCRVRRRVVLPRCHGCLGYGHVRASCPGPDRSQCCYKCGQQGHFAAACNQALRCCLCEERKEDKLDHLAGSGSCKTFRALLQAAKQRRG